MKRSYKIMYIALTTISAISCIAAIVNGAYQAAMTLGVVSVYTIMFYKYNITLAEVMAENEALLNSLAESAKREFIAKDEVTRLRKRCEMIEQARQTLEDAYQKELSKPKRKSNK